MIKLFRNTRKNLLAEGKTTKYLKYAIGEIILVVIGILIALSINNWNQNRKEAIEEKAILKTLLQNLNAAKKQSEALISEEETLKISLIRLLGIDANPSKKNDTIIPDSIFKTTVWDLQSDQPTFNAYNNLKNTNKLSLIKSKKINEKFTDLEFYLNRLNDVLEDRLSVHQIRVDNILENDINFIPLVKSSVPTINIEYEPQNNYNQLLKVKRIRNLLGMKLDFTQDAIDHRINLDKEIKDLITLIELELNKK
ncbi:DUF6090 family protein [Aequorivita lipolytica]|jgi:hypothetical protein|uniref:Uncharacterized protein n=1 Tax=Aequorivita lipolytica TaxID=153267 RepID=A0A5C6YQL8_9FLAO|nr:DUF6090 family protein [Aequorivita lipolytica]TXD69842.1 hypothetical protein ESV24_05220 [Aequorivita lipolytica]SRX50345.1 hypothetical protein AEQU2_00817 [Aequorivita lipolytica]